MATEDIIMSIFIEIDNSLFDQNNRVNVIQNLNH